MTDTLVIVESPAKAKTIGKYLGSKYKVVASNGHVRDLPKSQLGVDIDNGFEPKYITLRGRGDVLEKIKKEAKQAKKVLLATDPDREGEAISWHLANALHIDPQKNCRVVFNEITKSVLQASIKKARPIDENLVDAQQARRVLDRLVGYKISPLLWAKVRKGLSAGRVQSVATRIICDREQEIMDFEPEEYWTITAYLRSQYSKKPIEAKFYGYNGEKTDVKNEEEANSVIEKSKGVPFVLSDIKKTEKIRHAPAPFTTSSMLQEASRKLGLTPKMTMSLAQQLYEGVEVGSKGSVGLITYIRTDSVRVSAEAQAMALDFIKNSYGDKYVPSKPNIYKGRTNAQDAHEAIRPTNLLLVPSMLKDSLKSGLYRLYKLIYERFLASQMVSAVFETTQYSFNAGECTYHANGVKTVFDGYTKLYTESSDDAEEKEGTLPDVEQGASLEAEDIKGVKHMTQPPARYTEASLVKALEEKGIGRPSTYSPTISTIIERGYVCREKKQLLPTELGFVVTQLMKDNFKDIVDVTFTADMEEKLDEVEEGKKQWRKVIGDFYGPFEQSVDEAFKNVEHVKIPDEVSDVKCEKCGAMMVYKVGRFGKFLACPNYPTCKNTKRIVEKINVKCPKCGADIIKLHNKKGRAFYGCEKYPECDFVSWLKPTGENCPKCGKYMVQKIGKNGSYKQCSDEENCGYVLRMQNKQKAEDEE
ncbi:MAG: type I DNA topoisomerase [Clostridiales bacterium]|nr:type I DNA topoisomerase [Clostridiales bacterium]